MKFIQCFVLDIEVKYQKVIDLLYRGHIFKLVRFQWEWAQINWIIELIQKRYSFTYLGSQEVVNQGVKEQCPYMPNRPIGPMVCGSWTLTPPLTKIGTIRYMKLCIFLIYMTNQLIWAHFRWNWANLKIWPLYKRSMIFCCFDLYLENETWYEFHVIDFFAPYDPRNKFTCISS